MEELTHASFFSGVGGLDLGLERAGWRTVSFSEIDPYASAVLAERWPGVPNLGDITDVEPQQRRGDGGRGGDDHREQDGRVQPRGSDDWTDATLWTGGFPCQDLSVAGKRAGFTDGTRSSLAFTFLGLIERHRPPAVLLENVPGLLSSNEGRDFGRLLGEMVELGYGVSYRVLDARHFGVPQRRRRVFILGLRGDADDPTGSLAALRAAAVLAVGTRCDRHPPAGVKAGKGAAGGVGDGTIGTFTAGAHPGSYNGQDAYTGHLIPVGPSPDADRVRAADGLAGRVDGSRDVAEDRLAPTINSNKTGGWRFDADQVEMLVPGSTSSPSLGDPEGLDSARYRCCGNGVVAPVAEWIGVRLAAMFS